MRILDDIDLRTVIVMDIETVSAHKSYDELPEEWKALWDKKATTLKTEESPESFYERAAIYSEFGKVISIGVGLFVSQDREWHFKVKAYSGHDEKELLSDFARMLDKYFYNPEYRFCAHNGREFDIPYLCRRMIINGVRLPSILDVSGLKPWEVKHLDTLDLWKFGDFKAYTSLNVLALSLGIPSPKDDIDGSMVGKVYWQENDLERIDTYCLKDVITTGRVLMKLKGLEPFGDEKVIYPET
jgi:DNA polymerase elongation subunit (family B)